MAKMTTEEAFVKVLQMHGIEHAFGIIGSAFMPISDIFPDAGITFWDVAHETNGGLIADGYTRATGKMSMVIAQNGPGITGLVTPNTAQKVFIGVGKIRIPPAASSAHAESAAAAVIGIAPAHPLKIGDLIAVNGKIFPIAFKA